MQILGYTALGLFILFLVGIAVVLLPVKLAAAAVGARRTGFLWCLVALVVASILHALGLGFPVAGSIVAFLLAAWGFAWILGTGFLGGIGIAILHVVFTALIVAAFAVLGLSSLLAL
ncbi:MAG: hypothetical protein C4523_16960 [Myxococcales bacterium]|nr:MAG: hypothetical protein C4523_16960 [Myxococcales bacterium]